MGRRIKLSYTVDEDDVIPEVANLLGLSSENLQKGVSLFNDLQTELRKGSDDEAVNLHQCYEMIDKFRLALFNVDTRLSEITDIMRGMDEYRRALEETGTAVPPEEPPPEIETPDAD